MLLQNGRVYFKGALQFDFFETLRALSRVHLLFNPERTTDYYHAFTKRGLIHLFSGSDYCIHVWFLEPEFTEVEKTMDEFIKLHPGFARFIGE